MKNDMIVLDDELIDNPMNRVPIALCLDVSSSMNDDESGSLNGMQSKISELNEGIRLFFDAIRNNTTARYSAEIAIVTFNSNVTVVRDFQCLTTLEETAPMLTAYGATDLGGGVIKAIEILQTRKEQYRKTGVDYFQPWLVLMTDGEPTTDIHVQAAQEVCYLEDERKLTVFPIGIGQEADMVVLSMFSKKKPPLRLKGLNFCSFFEWLSKSVTKVSESRPGEKIRLDLEEIKELATPWEGWRAVEV